MPVVSALDDLGRHVLDGATEGVGPLLLLVGAELPGEAEVGDYDVAFCVQQDVLQLNITVDYVIL